MEHIQTWPQAAVAISMLAFLAVIAFCAFRSL